MKARQLFALFLVLALTVCSGTALAATSAKEAAKAPTVKMNSSGTVESGDYDEVVVNSSVPGFLTLVIENSFGGIVRTLADNVEIHSGDNNFPYTAYDDNGDPLPEDNYNYVATVTTQYGVSSGPVNRGFKIVVPEDMDDATAIASGLITSAAAVTGRSSTSSSSTSSSSTSSSSTSSTSSSRSATVAAVPVTYAHSSTQITIGEEGLEIGVGVADAYPQTELTYWTLPGALTDDVIWQAMIQPITVVNVDQQESSPVYDSPHEGRVKLGTVTGTTQGVNQLVSRSDGWSLVECYRNEDGAFMRGYIKTNKLKVTQPNQTYGILIDKTSQTLYAYMNGRMIGSCLVCTGRPASDALNRETPAGEFITAMRRGTVAYLNRGYSKYTVRINNTVHLQEIPSTKKNGTDFSLLQDYLGNKYTRGTICVQHLASTDGGVNAEWIWNITETNKNIKVLILDDKDRASIPVAGN